MLNRSKANTTTTDLSAGANTMVVIAHQLGLDPTAALQASDEALNQL